jgi:hypothetical protein
LTGSPTGHDAENVRASNQAFRTEATAQEGSADMDVSPSESQTARRRACAISRPWLGLSTNSVPPSHASTIACGSVAL